VPWHADDLGIEALWLNPKLYGQSADGKAINVARHRGETGRVPGFAFISGGRTRPVVANLPPDGAAGTTQPWPSAFSSVSSTLCGTSTASIT